MSDATFLFIPVELHNPDIKVLRSMIQDVAMSLSLLFSLSFLKWKIRLASVLSHCFEFFHNGSPG